MLHMKTSGLIFGGRLRCFFCGRFLPTARCFQTRTHHHFAFDLQRHCPGSIPYNVTCLKWPLWKCLLKKSCRLCGSLSLVVSCTTSLLWCIFWIQTIHLFSKHFETTAPAPSWNTLLRKGCNSLLLRSHTCRPPSETQLFDSHLSPLRWGTKETTSGCLTLAKGFSMDNIPQEMPSFLTTWSRTGRPQDPDCTEYCCHQRLTKNMAWEKTKQHFVDSGSAMFCTMRVMHVCL